MSPVVWQSESGTAPPADAGGPGEGVLRAIRGLIGLANLFLLMASVLFLVIAPSEIKQILAARTWVPRKVQILRSDVVYRKKTNRHGSGGGHSLKIEIWDPAENSASKSVSVRFGTFQMSLGIYSTLERDQAKYTPGKEVTAYRSPDGNQYVLEQNKITGVVLRVLFSLLLISVNVWIVMRRSRSGERLGDAREGHSERIAS